MIIRKLFKFEAAHIVRQCSTIRCRENIHGHSFVVEVFLSSDKLDNGFMIYDFGLLKKSVKTFIDSFDHSYLLWDEETESFKNSIHLFSERVVTLPVSPSAESLSLLFFHFIQKILKNSEFSNDEGRVIVSSVRVHETETGYAEAFEGDLKMLTKPVSGISMFNLFESMSCYHTFTKSIREDWEDQNWAKLGFNRE